MVKLCSYRLSTYYNRLNLLPLPRSLTCHLIFYHIYIILQVILKYFMRQRNNVDVSLKIDIVTSLQLLFLFFKPKIQLHNILKLL